MEDLTRPICAHCTKAARTVDTPNVKVRVERCTVWRGGEAYLTIRVRCHGAVETLTANDAPGLDEHYISRLEAFRGKER